MEAGLLRDGDLPPSWTDSGKSSASASDAEQVAVAKTIPVCRAFAGAVRREGLRPKTSSHAFVDSAAPASARGNVSNDVVVWPSIAAAKTAYAVYSAPTMKRCLTTLFRKVLTRQAAGSGLTPSLSVQRLPVAGIGDAAVGYEVMVSAGSGTRTTRVGFIIEIVRVGRYTVSYNATLYKSAPAGFGKNLVERSIARLEAAPAG